MKKKQQIALFGSGLFLLICISSGYAQNCGNAFTNVAFTCNHWTVQDGLPVNAINQILQSKQGYIWFGTFGGLVRFDGVRFKVYKSAEYPGLPGNRIVNLEETPDSVLWLRTEREKLVKFSHGIFRVMSTEDGLTGHRVRCLFKDAKGRLWIGTESGISVYENGSIKPWYPEMITEPLVQIYVDTTGSIWYVSDETHSLIRFDVSRKKINTVLTGYIFTPHFLTLHNGLTLFSNGNRIYAFLNGSIEVWASLPKDIKIIDLIEDQDGTVLAATLYHGIIKLTGKSYRNIHAGYRGRRMTGFGGRMGKSFLASGNKIWAIGKRQILLDNKTVFSFNNQITDFLIDREGSFWFASTSAGLFRLKPNMFTIYMPDEAIYPVIEARDGSIWFGYESGVARLKNDNLNTDFRFKTESIGFSIKTIVERANGDLIVSVGSEGMAKLSRDGKTFIPYPIPIATEMKNLVVYALYEDQNQNLWIGTDNGVFIQTKDGWKWFGVHSTGYVRYFSEAPDGTIWMGTYGAGIYHYKSGQLFHYNTKDGLSSNLIRAIYVDTSGTHTNSYVLWIGTEDNGMDRLPLKNGVPYFSKITHYNEQNGLYDNVVDQILVDDYGRFWMSGNKGISWGSRKELEQFAKGNISAIHPTAYTERDGLKNREANGGVQSAGIISSDGKIWFPTQGGLVMINPDSLIQNEVPPPVVIEKLTSNGERIAREDNKVRLKAGQRDFEIAYTGLSFMVSGKVRFKYRLKGFNDDWIKAGTRRTAFYTNVPPGIYRFEVVAANNEGIWSPEPASLTIEVLPFFYETNLFYLLLFMAAGMVFIAVIRLRTRHLKKREQELEQSVDDRTAELEAEKRKTEAQAKKLLKLDEAKSTFFTNITHEFKTPLTLIIGPLQKLLKERRSLSPDETDNEIKRMLRSSFRLQRLIDQILNISKLEAGELKLNVQQIDVVPFIRTILEFFNPLATEQNLELVFLTKHEHCLLYLDADALEKIVANLISNAIKFTPPNNKIRVKLEETLNSGVIKITDSGIGIPPDKIGHIFDRFYQADDSLTRASEGSGVGLALVKNLVELHEGTIVADSLPGKGTTFTLRFKKGKAHFTPKQFKNRPDSKVAPALSAKQFSGVHSLQSNNENTETEKDRATILIAEDNRDMRSFIHSILKDEFTVISATNGKEALEMTAAHLPDLIVADIMMPQMDGMELNRKLKTDSILASIPLIFLTAKSARDSKLKGLEDDADDYITKPFDPELLTARVENLIRKRKGLREYYLGKKSSQNEDEYADPFLKEVCDVLDEHFADPEFGILQLSELLHTDRTRLYRKLKKLTYKTPQQFLSDFRMKKAAQMLDSNEGNISEIAYASGFNTLSYFCSVFKKYYKISPGEYAKQLS